MGKIKLTKEDKKELKNFKWKIVNDKSTHDTRCIITGLSRKGKKLKNLVIPDCVHELANNCFYEHTKKKSMSNTTIESVKFGKNLKVIGSSAFFRCERLTVADFEDAENLEEIRAGAFKNANFIEIRLPKSLKVLDNAFTICDDGEKRKLYIPKTCTVKYEEDKRLYLCYTNSYDIFKYDSSIDQEADFLVPESGISSVKLTEEDRYDLRFFTYKIEIDGDDKSMLVITGLTDLGKAQKSLVIPDCVNKIENKALYDFSVRNKYWGGELYFPLKTIVIGKNVREIGEGAFYNCGLYSVDFSNAKNLKRIGAEAFAQNSNLEEIILPENVEIVEKNAFLAYGRNNLEIYVPENCKWEEEFCSPEYIKRYSGKLEVEPKRPVKNFFVPEIALEDYNKAVAADRKEKEEKNRREFLEQQKFEKEQAEIKKRNQEFLQQIQNPPEFSLSDRKNFIYTDDHRFPGLFVVNKLNETVRESKKSKIVFPDCISAYFGKGAYNFAYIREVVLSKNLMTLAEEAFAGCKSVNKINLEDCSVLQIIPRMAFKGSGIREIIIPKNVKKIESEAFSDCHNLKRVKLASGSRLESIGRSAFANCENLEEIDLSNATNLKIIEDFAFGADIVSVDKRMLPNYSLKKVVVSESFDPDALKIPFNIFGSGIEYSVVGNTLVPDNVQLKQEADKWTAELKELDESYHKEMVEKAKIRREIEEQEFNRTLELAEEYKNAGIKHIDSNKGHIKNLELALDNLEMSYKYDKDPYVATLIEEIKARIRSGEPIIDPPKPSVSKQSGAITDKKSETESKEIKNQSKSLTEKENKTDSKLQNIADFEDFDDFVPETSLDKKKRKQYEKHLEEALNGNKRWYSLVAGDYKNGYGCNKDISKAIYWYEKALRAGFGGFDAMFVAECYYNGIGVDRDLDKAYKYCQRAYAHTSLAESQVKCEELFAKINKERGVNEDINSHFVSNKPQISIDSFENELKRTLDREFYGYNMYISIGRQIGDTVRMFPENLSYIKNVNFNIVVNGGYEEYGTGAKSNYTANLDKEKKRLERMGTSYDEVSNFNSNDTDLWTKATIDEMDSLKSGIYTAQRADEWHRRQEGWNNFSRRAREVIDNFIREYSSYDIMADGSLGTVLGTGMFSKVKTEKISCPIKKITYKLTGKPKN